MTREQQKFILTEDTRRIGEMLLMQKPQGIDDYLSATSQALQNGISAVSPDIKFQTFREAVIEGELSTRVELFLQTKPTGICICLDRFLLKEVEDNRLLNNRFSRLQICRSIAGERVSRQSAPSLEQQINTLLQKYPDIPKQEILIVDDGVFSGGTINSVLQLLSQINISEQQVSVLGFIGDNAANSLQDKGISTEIVVDVPNLYDWVDQRDFSVFGGKLMVKSRSNNYSSSVPYLPPWDNGAGASLDKSEQLISTSTGVIDAQVQLLTVWEKQIGKRITFKDMVLAGFPFPTNRTNTIPVSLKQPVIDYLTGCKQLVDRQWRSK